MTRILLRAHKSPFESLGAEAVLRRNRIGNNTGNQVFSQSAYRLLSVRDVEIDARRLTGLTAAQVNADYDALVIPLANAFRVSFRNQLEELSSLIEALTIPVTVVGVGVQAPLVADARPSAMVDDAVRRFVRTVLSRSGQLGVRGQITADYLATLGFREPEVQVIGCPSMFMHGPHLSVTKRVDQLGDDSPIALNLSPYEHTAALGPLCIRLAAEHPNLIYVAQDHHTLELMVTGNYGSSRALDPGLPVHLDHPLVAANRIRMFLDPKPWMDFLSRHHFALGTRIHGNITALLAGTPAVLLAHDARTLELAEYHQLPHRSLAEASALSAQALYAEADLTPLNTGHPARWHRFRDYLESSGLRHVYAPGEDWGADFDRRLAEVEFAPPVQMINGEPLTQLYELRRRNRELRAQLKRVRGELAQLRAGGASGSLAGRLRSRFGFG